MWTYGWEDIAGRTKLEGLKRESKKGEEGEVSNFRVGKEC